MAELEVGVGTVIAHNPLHGSGRAELPHPALALGNDAHAAQRIGMTDSRQWQPTVDETPHTVPVDTAVLAAPRQRAMPEPSNLKPKRPQRRSVHGHTVVPDVATQDRLQPLTLVGDGFVHAPLNLGFHRVQLRLHPFADRLPQHREHSVASRKAEKVCFVNGVQHLDRGPLDDLVLQHRHSKRSLPPVGLGDIHPTHRLRSVRSSLQPFGKVLEIPLQFFSVVPPRLPVYTWRGFLLQREVGHAQGFEVADPLSYDFFIHYTSPV